MATGEYYVGHNMQTDEYLAKKFLRGYYMTPDVTAALKCKDEMELRKEIEKAAVDYKSQIVVETVTVY